MPKSIWISCGCRGSLFIHSVCQIVLISPSKEFVAGVGSIFSSSLFTYFRAQSVCGIIDGTSPLSITFTSTLPPSAPPFPSATVTLIVTILLALTLGAV